MTATGHRDRGATFRQGQAGDTALRHDRIALARRWLPWTTAGYSLFVVYGSLVPLELVPLPLDEAIARFAHIRYLDLGIQSRADWVANILLFIPLGFLWSGLSGLRPSLGTALLIWLAATGFSVAIEFTQVFFPQRTVSINDILAESLGAAFGILAWRRWGRKLLAWAGQWPLVQGRAGRAERLLYLYLFVLFAYNLLPLDLILSPVAFYHKWQEGRILLQPFQSHYQSTIDALYDLAGDVVVWIPPTLLWLWSGRARPSQAFAWTLAGAACLEFLQLFVWSRVTDTTDLFTAALGAGAGILIGRRFAPRSTFPAPGSQAPANTPVRLPALVIGWSLLLLVVFWYPWTFDLDPESIRARAARLGEPPFHAYYFGTEFRAISSLLSKLAFFMPLGALLAAWRSGRPSRSRWPDHLLIAAGMAFGLLLELGQVLIPGKTIDLADWLITTTGLILGFHGWRYLRDPSPFHTSQARRRARDDRRFPGILSGWTTTIVILTLLGGFLAQSDAVPYNLRELTGSGLIAWAGVAGLLMAALGAFGPPMWMANHMENTATARRLPLWVALHAAGVFLLLRLTMPLEGLHDILGAPVLDWPSDLELLARFLGLFGSISFLLAGAALAATAIERPGHGPMLLRWSLMAAVLLPLGYWVVVTQAATDNLTELMRGGGTWISGLALAGWWWLVGLSGSLIALAWRNRRVPRRAALLLLLLSLLPGWLLAWLGTESEIYKYGQFFSALQFLLSPDRQHYVEGAALIGRYIAAQLGLAGLIALAQYPFTTLRDTPQRPDPRTETPLTAESAPRRSRRDRGRTGRRDRCG